MRWTSHQKEVAEDGAMAVLSGGFGMAMSALLDGLRRKKMVRKKGTRRRGEASYSWQSVVRSSGGYAACRAWPAMGCRCTWACWRAWVQCATGEWDQHGAWERAGASSWARPSKFKYLNFSNLGRTWKLLNLTFPNSKNSPNFVRWQFKTEWTTFLFGLNSNFKWILNYKIRKWNGFEFGLNLLGLQTFGKKSG
jgi:hypothetical protein